MSWTQIIYPCSNFNILPDIRIQSKFIIHFQLKLPETHIRRTPVYQGNREGKGPYLGQRVKKIIILVSSRWIGIEKIYHHERKECEPFTRLTKGDFKVFLFLYIYGYVYYGKHLFLFRSFRREKKPCLSGPSLLIGGTQGD